jgi:hypothetical protein
MESLKEYFKQSLRAQIDEGIMSGIKRFVSNVTGVRPPLTDDERTTRLAAKAAARAREDLMNARASAPLGRDYFKPTKIVPSPGEVEKLARHQIEPNIFVRNNPIVNKLKRYDLGTDDNPDMARSILPTSRITPHEDIDLVRLIRRNKGQKNS